MVGIYIHIPWCLKKCHYCDFNSHGISSKKVSDLESSYISALQRDWQYDMETLYPDGEIPEISSVFIGGGTPSLFSGAAVKRMIKLLCSDWKMHDPQCEITIEANPSTTDYQKYCEFLESGVNRLSIGAQSFDTDLLKKLGRTHDDVTIEYSFETARRAGLNNINIDLMYSLPMQESQSVVNDIERAIALGVDHISWYQLTIEPATAFAKHPPVLPSSEKTWIAYTKGRELLTSHRYQQYEVAAFTKGKKCAHNINYWNYGDYLGFGAGAHSKITQNGRITRYAKIKSPGLYDLHAGKKEQFDFHEEITLKNQSLDCLMNVMRLYEGFSIDILRERTLLSSNQIDSLLKRLQYDDWIQLRNSWITPTPKANSYLNQLLASV